MNIWLDDNRPAPAGWTRARTAEEAKLRLLRGDVDRLSLDYDLDVPECPTCNFACGYRGGACRRSCTCHAAGDETGGDLLNWMVHSGAWPRQKPEVHSQNVEHAPKMRKLVEERWPGDDVTASHA